MNPRQRSASAATSRPSRLLVGQDSAVPRLPSERADLGDAIQVLGGAGAGGERARPSRRLSQTAATRAQQIYERGILIALSAMMFFCTSVVPAPIDV